MTRKSGSLSFGSEEAGLRGSRRYVERHLDELKRLEARLLNIETVAHPEIAILTLDTSGTVKNSPEMVKSVVAAAERAGVPYQVQPAAIGVGTDCGPLQQGGPQSHDAAAFQNAATNGGLLPPEVGWAGSFDYRAAVKCAEAHFRVGAQWWGAGENNQRLAQNQNNRGRKQ